jgi:hypothetical protein
MFTLEINGRAIAVINAGTQEEAEDTFESEAFKDEIAVLETEGQPLWNGSEELFIRRAFPEEVAKFEAAYARALKAGDAEEDSEYIFYLVPVTDPTDDEDDEDA